MNLNLNLGFFLASLALTLGVVGAALIYLRASRRRILLALCESGDGADFWLRAADLLALSGSLMLVLAFGGFADGNHWVTQLRLSLGLTLAGLFVTVVMVASSLWRQMPPVDAATATAPAPVPSFDVAASTGAQRQARTLEGL